jgi:hypothetical protein
MEYDDFELQLGPRVGASLHVRVLCSPAGTGGSQVPIEPLIGLAAASREETPAAIGATLFQTLFHGEVGNLFHASVQRAGRGLRLRLRIEPRDADLAPLHQVPWELLYRPTTEDFLALNRSTPVVRSFDIARPAMLPEFEPPLRLLAVSGSQDPHNPLNLSAELAELEGTLHRNSEIEVEPLEDPEPQALRFALTRQPFDALHFMGHGVFDPLSGGGSLLCRGPGGCRQPLGGRHLATKLKDLGSLRLVVLNACDTARASGAAGHDPFAGVATALVLGGVPAVVAMQSPIDDDHALAFSAAFYDRLAHGLTVEEAVAEGRQAIYSLRPNGPDWSSPVLFLRTPTGDLFPLITPKPIAFWPRATPCCTERLPQVAQHSAVPPSRGLAVDLSAEGVAPYPIPFPPELAPKHSRAVEIWEEKLCYLREQETVLSDPAQKFGVRKQIDEARARICELGG